MNTRPPTERQQLARSVRERFVAELGLGMRPLTALVQERLGQLMDEPCTSREAQQRRDAWTAFKRAGAQWCDNTTRAWQEALAAGEKKAAAPDRLSAASLELVGAEVFENKILASRMAMAVMDKVHAEFDDLRLRMRHLEGTEDLGEFDVLRPDVPVLKMVEQWGACSLPTDAWSMVSEVVQRTLVESLNSIYQKANQTLVQQGVMPTITLQDRVKSPVRAPGKAAASGAAPRGEAPAPQAEPGEGESGPGTGVAEMGSAVPAGAFYQRASPGAAPASSARGQAFWQQSGPSGHGGGGASVSVYAGADPGAWSGASALARTRARAQGVVGQIRRFFLSHTGGDLVGARVRHAPSAGLMAALAQQGPGFAAAGAADAEIDVSPAGMAYVATQLRERSAALKEKAQTKGEKATIEIVALMFQAILAEDRIPPGIRVWIARLQMPVLRVALEDAEFLGTTAHPARLLIDRMGSVVMGFDAAGGHGAAMEQEIKRVVQVIEQYPETGKKVYQVVYDEFEKFLAKFLTEKGPAKKVVSVAQQVEQKETLAIQYTIEMRNMLRDMPVRDEIRMFLFKVWAEVLAVAAVRKGPQHADTLTLKKTATDLVWSASAKPSRTERAKVIQELPNLLLRLRSGMTLLGMAPQEQEDHIKSVSDTLQDAFLSKTQSIGQDKIDALAQRLGHLEDFIAEDGLGDLPLDAESIEMMLGMDAAGMEVIANGGSKPTAAMVAWAQELQVGSWYRLHHQQQMAQVQLVWRSVRKHLNLFASVSGTSYLIQAGRLAAYLQAGLLTPQEEEALTVRATRDALSKLEKNPEQALV
ncbi:MAG: DUF1631 family protein [Rhodoferax sp.]